MGRHYGPWPGPTLRALLARDSLFHTARTVGGAVLANAYPRATPRRWPRACAGHRRTADRATAARRASAPMWRRRRGPRDRRHGGLRGRPGRRRRPRRARPRRFASEASVVPGRSGPRPGGRLARLAADTRSPSSTSGAATGPGTARTSPRRAFVARLDLPGRAPRRAADDVTLLVTSDHGNLEDLSSPRHTLARVPLLAVGPHARPSRRGLAARRGACRPARAARHVTRRRPRVAAQPNRISSDLVPRAGHEQTPAIVSIARVLRNASGNAPSPAHDRHEQHAAAGDDQEVRGQLDDDEQHRAEQGDDPVTSYRTPKGRPLAKNCGNARRYAGTPKRSPSQNSSSVTTPKFW
jgi:hypothetical protein